MCPAPYILFGFVCWTSCFVLYYRWCVLLVVHRFVLNKGLQVVVMHLLHNVQCSAHPTGVVSYYYTGVCWTKGCKWLCASRGQWITLPGTPPCPKAGKLPAYHHPRHLEEKVLRQRVILDTIK